VAETLDVGVVQRLTPSQYPPPDLPFQAWRQASRDDATGLDVNGCTQAGSPDVNVRSLMLLLVVEEDDHLTDLPQPR
jgi:hypothetical protein